MQKSHSEMFDDFDKPVKFYRTVGDAFKDADYACAVEVQKESILTRFAFPFWLAVVLLATFAAMLVSNN